MPLGDRLPQYCVADLVIDVGRRSVRRGASEIHLSKLSFDVLQTLIEAAPNVVSNDELTRAVWRGVVVGPESVTQRIKLLRDALGDDPEAPRYILGLRGQGYRVLPLVTLESETGNATSPEAQVSINRPRMVGIVLGATALAVALAWFGIDQLLVSKHRADPSAAITFGKSSAHAPEASGTSGTPDVAPFPPSPHSIAVLPFVDMSEKKDQEYFSDGLAEELIDLLAKTPELHVIARTSSFYFKGKSDDIPTIASKLKVANILEGSVRKSGTRLRVSAQLVRAANGEHMWSETYDRELKDVFKMQDEIAAAVVEALKVRLLPAHHVVNQHRTGNLDAYTEYLLGSQLSARDTNDSNQQALAAFRRAVALDPGYAAAYSGLAVSEWRVAEQTTGEPAAYQRAVAAADRAIALAPTSPAGYWARGTLRYLNSFDWDGARADFDQALALDANDVRTLVSYGRLQATLVHLPEAIALTRRAIALDPLSVDAWDWLSFYLICGGQFAAARDATVHAVRIWENRSPGAVGSDFLLELLTGNAQAALARAPYGFDEAPFFITALSQHSLGHIAESQAALDALIGKRADSWGYQIAEIYAWRGEADHAIEWLERSYRQQDPGMTRLAIDPLLRRLHTDRRFQALLHKMRLPG